MGANNLRKLGDGKYGVGTEAILVLVALQLHAEAEQKILLRNPATRPVVFLTESVFVSKPAFSMRGRSYEGIGLFGIRPSRFVIGVCDWRWQRVGGHGPAL